MVASGVSKLRGTHKNRHIIVAPSALPCVEHPCVFRRVRCGLQGFLPMGGLGCFYWCGGACIVGVSELRDTHKNRHIIFAPHVLPCVERPYVSRRVDHCMPGFLHLGGFACPRREVVFTGAAGHVSLVCRNFAPHRVASPSVERLPTGRGSLRCLSRGVLHGIAGERDNCLDSARCAERRTVIRRFRAPAYGDGAAFARMPRLPQGYGAVLTRRKPMLLLRFVGSVLFQFDERQLSELLFQLPPRMTRFPPDTAVVLNLVRSAGAHARYHAVWRTIWKNLLSIRCSLHTTIFPHPRQTAGGAEAPDGHLPPPLQPALRCYAEGKRVKVHSVI
jgi:hypothetical protein